MLLEAAFDLVAEALDVARGACSIVLGIAGGMLPGALTGETCMADGITDCLFGGAGGRIPLSVGLCGFVVLDVVLCSRESVRDGVRNVLGRVGDGVGDGGGGGGGGSGVFLVRHVDLTEELID